MEHRTTPTITVYTTGPRCVDCNTIKNWLTQNGYSYTERNIREDPAALEELTRLGYRGAPITVIGETIVDGLEMDEIKAALGHQG
ncbi:MAG TPA: glutaredoxin family protein [Herpetosiphonaceae bacterium]